MIFKSPFSSAILQWWFPVLCQSLTIKYLLGFKDWNICSPSLARSCTAVAPKTSNGGYLRCQPIISSGYSSMFAIIPMVPIQPRVAAPPVNKAQLSPTMGSDRNPAGWIGCSFATALRASESVCRSFFCFTIHILDPLHFHVLDGRGELDCLGN